MTRPDQSGEEPGQPGTGPAGPPGGGSRSADPPEPAGQPWDWAIDPAPPVGPSQQPVPDPAAGPAVDAIPEPIPPGVGAPPGAPGGPPGDWPPAPGGRLPGPGGGPGPGSWLPGPGSGPGPPAWSTPDTPASTPPLSGYPGPPHWSGAPGGPAGPGEEPRPGAPGPAGPIPDRPRPADRRWWFVLGIVAALLSCCCVAAALITLAWGPDLFNGLSRPGERVVGFHQTTRDGDLEFRVSRLRCGLTEVGDPLVSQLAMGQFCVVELTVRNLGTRPVVFHDNLQIAYGPAGQRFGVDSSAGLLANADQHAFLAEINPGNRVTGAIVYDIPPDSRIVRLRLHGSATSPGVQVRTG